MAAHAPLHSRRPSAGAADALTAHLAALGVAQEHAALFKAAGVDVALLPHLGDADLREMGVATIGARRRILGAIAKSAEGGRKGQRQMTMHAYRAPRSGIHVAEGGVWVEPAEARPPEDDGDGDDVQPTPPLRATRASPDGNEEGVYPSPGLAGMRPSKLRRRPDVTLSQEVRAARVWDAAREGPDEVAGEDDAEAVELLQNLVRPDGGGDDDDLLKATQEAP